MRRGHTRGAPQKAVGLVAHDRMKPVLAAWVERHRTVLERRPLVSTATTGAALAERCPGLAVERLASGPEGGDQQMGARIVEGRIAALFFFIDPMTPMPHDVDVKALVRLATLYDVPLATSPATADAVVATLR
jgi:methylglyoxal synthase